MTKKLLLLASLPVLICCSADKMEDKSAPTPSANKVTTVLMTAAAEGVQKIIANPCDTFSYEFSGLYPILDTLPNAFSDSLLIDNYLKALGFELRSSGFGNWAGGPRLMTLELTKGNCTCKVLKKYYYNDPLAAGRFNLRVTEKVVCNANNTAVD